ncbi:phage holin family protein [Phascolarctobacterium succinatutens]|uniref:phage holin family protein n=1 Tax=Phascolarctobacterium succinatutens TaxID=626940 RepID=UPI0030768C78
MNYKLFFESAFAAGKTLYSGWSYKTAMAAIMVVLLHRHAILFYAFSALVVLDCLTKWLAIAHDYLVKQGKTAPTIFQSLIAIKAARSAGLISSGVMKHRFLGKICIYLLCVMAAASADLIMVELSKPAWAVSTIIGYLTATELLSIVENLNAAGVEAVKGLIDIVKKKKV